MVKMAVFEHLAEKNKANLPAFPASATAYAVINGRNLEFQI
jgi:hypothetical protein